jgi:hypothetical protein
MKIRPKRYVWSVIGRTVSLQYEKAAANDLRRRLVFLQA